MVTALYSLTHCCIARGEDIRSLDLADLYLNTISDVKPTALFVLTMVLRQGKTVDGGTEFTGCGRHIDPVCCAISHLMVWLFYQYHIQRRTPPNFRRKCDWYFDRVFPGWSKDTLLLRGTAINVTYSQ